MAQAALFVSNRPADAAVTLASVVMFDGEYGVVWHVTPDTLRVLPLRPGRGVVTLSLESELGLHLPGSPIGWHVVHDELVAWPRPLCAAMGELEERCLFRLLEARRAGPIPVSAAIARQAMAAAVHQAIRH
jgi:hypothetical protein